MIDDRLREAADVLRQDVASTSPPPLPRPRNRRLLVGAVAAAAAAVIGAIIVVRLPSDTGRISTTQTLAEAPTSSSPSSVPGASPAGAAALLERLGDPVPVAGSSDEGWQVTVRPAKSGHVADGYCVDVEPAGGSACAENGSDQLSGAKLLSTSQSVQVIVWRVGGDTERVEAEWSGGAGSATADVVRPFADSRNGFAAIRLPVPELRVTFRAIGAAGQVINEDLVSAEPASPTVVSNGPGWIVDAAALPTGWTFGGAGNGVSNTGEPLEIDRDTIVFRYNADRTGVDAAGSIGVGQSGSAAALLQGFSQAPSTPNSTVAGHPAYSFSILPGDNMLAWVDQDRWVRLDGPISPADEVRIAEALIPRADGGFDTGWLPDGFEQVAVVPGARNQVKSNHVYYLPLDAVPYDQRMLFVTLDEDRPDPVDVDLRPILGMAQQPYATEVQGHRAVVTPSLVGSGTIAGNASIRWQVDATRQLSVRGPFPVEQLLTIARSLQPVDSAQWTDLLAQTRANAQKPRPVPSLEDQLRAQGLQPVGEPVIIDPVTGYRVVRGRDRSGRDNYVCLGNATTGFVSCGGAGDLTTPRTWGTPAVLVGSAGVDDSGLAFFSFYVGPDVARVEIHRADGTTTAADVVTPFPDIPNYRRAAAQLPVVALPACLHAIMNDGRDAGTLTIGESQLHGPSAPSPCP